MPDIAGLGRPSGAALSALDALAARLVTEGVAPAVAVAWARPAGPAGSGAADGGAAGAVGPRQSGAVTPDTLFDLASVTKPFVACTLARLAATGGGPPLGTPLGRLLPEARGTASAEVPLELLLAHRAGLAAHLPLFEPLISGRAVSRAGAIAAAASARRADCAGEIPAGGFPPLYSDLGYLLAGRAIEVATARPLDALIRELVATPLDLEVGSARCWLGRDPARLRTAAWTEHVPWRGGWLRGVVHDENAWALHGHGAAGHAGLFGTARAVAGLGAALLAARSGRSAWLSTAALEPLVARRPGGTLRAGFDGVAGEGSSAGPTAGPDTFGHLGFTGTSLWCDPAAGTAVALLTNRVCPSRAHLGIRAARPAAHAELWAAAAQSGQTIPPSVDGPA